MRKIKIIVIITISILGLLALSGCFGEKETPKVTKIEASDVLILKLGQPPKTLEVTVTPQGTNDYLKLSFSTLGIVEAERSDTSYKFLISPISLGTTTLKISSYTNEEIFIEVNITVISNEALNHPFGNYN